MGIWRLSRQLLMNERDQNETALYFLRMKNYERPIYLPLRGENTLLFTKSCVSYPHPEKPIAEKMSEGCIREEVIEKSIQSNNAEESFNKLYKDVDFVTYGIRRHPQLLDFLAQLISQEKAILVGKNILARLRVYSKIKKSKVVHSGRINNCYVTFRYDPKARPYPVVTLYALGKSDFIYDVFEKLELDELDDICKNSSTFSFAPLVIEHTVRQGYAHISFLKGSIYNLERILKNVNDPEFPLIL
jgi:hypothetical protein